MDNLIPAEITLDIFSRLPAESVLQCRQVCKTWRTYLLHHPSFAHMHLHRSQKLEKVGLLYFNGYEDYEKQLYYGEYDENDEQSLKTLRWIKHPLVNMLHDMVASCNGLVCFSVHNNGIEDPVYICNPVTREYVILPRLGTDVSKGKYFKGCIVSSFGYLPRTNEYKVVRIYYRRDRNQPQSCACVGFVQVYTLGGGSGWRNKGEIMYSPLLGRDYIVSSRGILANGALHWLDVDTEMKIVVFDLADEEFSLLPSVPCLVPGEDNYFQLQVLGGFLCVVHLKTGECVDIWLLKQNKCSSTPTYDMKEQEGQSWSWSRDFSISWEGLYKQERGEYKPFPFTKSNEVLLWYNGIILSRYDPNTATLIEVDTDSLMFQAIPHVNSFVSLEALGEEDVRIIESADHEGIPELKELLPNFNSTV